MKKVDITSTIIMPEGPLLPDQKADAVASPSGNVLTFDPTEFIAHIAPLDMTDEQATELLGAIWSIMVAFVDLGFGIHPVQQAQNARNGGVSNSAAALDPESALVVSCRETFNAFQKDKAGPRAKSRRLAGTDS